jgi:hypothetical protein
VTATADRRAAATKVDPAFIAAVVFLRRTCSVNDMATILGCDRKRVLTVLARLATLGSPAQRDGDAPRFRPLTLAQQADVTALHNNGRGLDFYALCRVLRDVHPLGIFVFLRNEVHPRGWWMRPCAACGEPFASPRSALRHCSAACAPDEREMVYA